MVPFISYEENEVLWIQPLIFNKPTSDRCFFFETLERLAKDKHSSLLQTFANYGRKKLYNAGPCINLERFILVCTNINGLAYASNVLRRFPVRMFFRLSLSRVNTGVFDDKNGRDIISGITCLCSKFEQSCVLSHRPRKARQFITDVY